LPRRKRGKVKGQSGGLGSKLAQIGRGRYRRVQKSGQLNFQ